MNEDRFWELALRWHAETAIHSSFSRRLKHPAAEEILKMGPEVVPYILRAYDIIPDWWGGFLSELMGTRPPTSWYEPGVYESVKNGWLRWAGAIGIAPAPFPPDRTDTAVGRVEGIGTGTIRAEF